MDKIAFGSRIRKFRRKRNLTSEKLAEFCDCSHGTIKKIESGARLPSLPALVNLCNVLKVSPNDMLGAEITHSFDKVLAEHGEDDQKERLVNLLLRLQRLSPEKFEAACATMETLLTGFEKP